MRVEEMIGKLTVHAIGQSSNCIAGIASIMTHS
jgi:hypothetical protein